MTKNGSNARKAKIRDSAARSGKTYRQAARDIDDRAEIKAAIRAALHSPEALAEERDSYLAQMLTADLPETVKVCLYVLSGRLGTARYTDTRGVKCSKVELAAETGLDVEGTCLNLYLAEAHGWVTAFHDDEARLTVPGEDIAMYQGFLDRWKRIVAVPELYGPLQETVAKQAAAELSEWGEWKRRWTGGGR
ncbi:hypothetical protein DBP19_35185 [Streptomyces sp. CS090A]|uniref:hypothetical protein n=1 Tax=Streptomyces sp. CS090A TaxID=2162710 RepID=UPI000D50A657|nr:hypothetical protein [Streptomyces sp. CS090A]PVC80750.1 hypothetical protein DBP19_35185 [Streptomyces sp. CS090A]